jgi:hypothetical protein
MIQIIKFADIFYHKRFILEKDIKINALIGAPTDVIEIEEYTETIETEEAITE